MIKLLVSPFFISSCSISKRSLFINLTLPEILLQILLHIKFLQTKLLLYGEMQHQQRWLTCDDLTYELQDNTVNSPNPPKKLIYCMVAWGDPCRIPFTPVAWGDQYSANVCPCTCRKRQLIIRYKLSNTTGLLYACLLACSEAYEFGQLGTGLSWFRWYTVPKAVDFFFKQEPTASLRGDHELQPQS